MISFSKDQGFAEDIGDIWHNDEKNQDQEDPIEVRVRIDLCDENEISFNWKEGKKRTTLYIPIDRIRGLVADDDENNTATEEKK